MLITDGAGDLARIEAAASAAIRGGCRCVQLREHGWSARQVASASARLQGRLDEVGGLLLVNDRVDVAAAGLASGAQVGCRSIPVELARTALPRPSLLGYSAHDADELRAAATAGCDFALLAPVWSTASKPGRSGLGVAAAGALTAAAELPVIWLGGVSLARAADVGGLPTAQRPSGLAAMSALMSAPDPEEVARALLAALGDVAVDPERG